MKKIAIALVGLWLACSDSPVNEAEPAVERARTEADIQIVVIRHLIDEGGDDVSGSDFLSDVVCIGTAPGPDPSPAVIEAFKDRDPPVRPNSECGSKEWEGLLTYRVHVPTGKGAIEYGLSAVNYQEPGRASLQVHYYSNGMSSGYWTCSVQEVGSRWEVESCTGGATS